MRESIGLSCTVPFRTQMRRSAATASGLYYDRVPLVMHSGCVQDSWRDALWPSPTVSHTGDEWEGRLPNITQIQPLTALCVGAGLEAFLARQVPTNGRCKTVAKTDSRGWRPAVRFDHSPFEYNGEVLQTTNHEPRATIFSTSRRSLEAMLLVGGYCREAASESEATGDRRAVSPQNSMNDERPTMNGAARP